MSLNFLNQLELSTERRNELEPRVQSLVDLVQKEGLVPKIEQRAEMLAEILGEPHERLSNLFNSLSRFFPDLPEEQGEHCKLMYVLTSVIGTKLDLLKRKGSSSSFGEDLKRIGYAGFLHDIGKSALSSRLIQRIDEGVYLDREYFELMKLHIITGYMVLSEAADLLDKGKEESGSYLKKIAVAVACHHEEMGGFGYVGLKGEEIPLVSRATALVDSLLAMARRRGYDPAIPPEEAYQELYRCSGLPFDKDLLGECNKRKLAAFEKQSDYRERLVSMIQRNTKYGQIYPRDLDISYTDISLLDMPALEEVYLAIRLRSEKQFDPNIVQAFRDYVSKNPGRIKKLVQKKVIELI
ncbi:HD domain-containing protein [Candidatus Woesearchaeota archaeon]|nr:HD domain-containing protein [Candidatus Woesearchaeota archaeon]